MISKDKTRLAIDVPADAPADERDMRKQAIYLHRELLEQIKSLQFERQRSLSFLIQQALTHWLAADAPDVRVYGKEKRR